MNVPDVMTIKDALDLMRREQVLRLPMVSADGALQGILSTTEVILDSEKGTGKDKENVQTFVTLVETLTGAYILPARSEETPPAFDEKGYSPVERLFNEPEED